MLEVLVDPAEELGPVKPLNGVNNAPLKPRSDQTRSCWDEFAALKVASVRTHDMGGCFEYGGQHAGDITALFPDFDADENDPKSYDFVLTDWVLGQWRETGAEILFRLGQTIEHWPKKYGTVPPKDYAKWARVCEHVIRHYNGGWADGHRWNIRQWEIWNEYNLDNDDAANKRTWGGTKEEFFCFYETVAKHLKATFPDLSIGGPAICYKAHENTPFEFIDYCRDHQVPLDFFSWHRYSPDVEPLLKIARQYRAALDAAGYTRTVSFCDEWNYNNGWGDGFQKSAIERQGVKGAAATMATMCALQEAPVDALHYYELRPGRPQFNGVFDDLTMAPLKAYWAFYAWRRLRALGTQVKVTVEENADGIRAVAAEGTDGRLTAVVSRFTKDDSVVARRAVLLKVSGRPFAEGVVKVVDSRFSYGETVVPVSGGALALTLEPNAFVVVDCAPGGSR